MRDACDGEVTALFAGGRFRLAMGLAPLAEAQWLAPDAAREATLAEKRALLAHRHGEVFQALPEAAAASAELLDLLARHLAAFMTCGCIADALAAMAALHPLDAAGRLVQDDLCLMSPSGAHYVLVGASLAAPNRWRLAEKLGRPLAAIHAPVPGYEAAIGGPVERFFAALKPPRIFARVNWGIADDPARFQPASRAAAALTPGEAGEKLWLRIERQTLRRLPATGAVLFTIRTEIARLDDAVAAPEAARDLAAAIRGMSPQMRAYKHIAAAAPALLDWLDARSRAPESTATSAA